MTASWKVLDRMRNTIPYNGELDYFTITVKFIPGWTRQYKWNVPPALNGPIVWLLPPDT
jgi:hypothetical protein